MRPARPLLPALSLPLSAALVAAALPAGDAAAEDARQAVLRHDRAPARQADAPDVQSPRSTIATAPRAGALTDADAIPSAEYRAGVILPPPAATGMPVTAIRTRPAAELSPDQQAAGTPAITSPPGSFSALPRLLAEARQLIETSPEAAWQLLEPHTWDYAGSRDFDFLLGVSALDSQRPGEAVIALERVLDNNPDDIAARTEIVRAYLALDERATAEQALQQLARTSDLPDEAVQSIRLYLDILARRNGQQQRRWQLGLDLTLGTDGNANVGSSHGRWLIDDGTVLTPLPGNRPQRSPFAEASLSLNHQHPLSETLEWSSSLLASQRLNSRLHEQDLGSLGLSSGLAWQLGAHRLSAAANLQQMLLDGHCFRHAAGLIGQWQYQASGQTQLGLYAQHFLLRFRGQPMRDAVRSVAGLSLAHALPGPGAAVLLANPYGGREHTRQHIRQLDFRLIGLRLGWQHNLSPRWRASLGLQYEQRDHDGTDLLFGKTRQDRQTDLRLSADYRLNARWTLTPLLQYTRNHATVAPNDFRRTQLSVNVQYRY